MTSRTQQAVFIAALISTCGLQSLSGEPAIFWVTNNSSDDTVANSLPAILAEVPPESEGEIPIIKFNLPADQHVIELTETLGIWKTVIIDGTSQTGYQGKPIIEITAGTPSDSQSNPWEFHGLDLMEPNTEIKGLSITGFIGGGIHINTTNCKIQSCFIGLRPDGRTARANQIGLWVNGNDTQIGGKSTPDRNIISGNHSTGIYLSSDNNSVYGNYIGTDCDGNSGVDNGHIPISLHEIEPNGGIEVGGSSNRIGGSAPGEANLIKGNLWNGVTVIGGTKNTIRGNQFIANQQLAIDLAADTSIPGYFPSGNFITINDDLDGDSGPNDLLNMPRLDYAYETDDLLVIIATYRGEPSTDITIDFYLNEETDSSGYGEAQYYLGNTDLFTDSSGIADLDIHYLDSPPDANFWWADAVFPIPTNNASFVTATATDADGNTSEFCPNIHILPADAFIHIHTQLGLQDRGPIIEEDVANPATTLWTVPKDGWERENSGALALLDEIPDAGILEWAGWSIVDRNWWIDVSDSSFESNFFPRQGREFFTGVNEAIAVADPDEWFDDYFSNNPEDPLPEYFSTLKTPSHTINPNIPGNQGFLIFNTSWRPSGNQTGVVLVSYDDAPPVELTRFDATSPFMANRAIKLPVTIPQGAQTARFYFRMEKARNDYWWALDSIDFYQLDSLAASGGRRVFATDVSGSPGDVLSVPFTLQGYGDEKALGFSIQFDHEHFEFSGLNEATGLTKVSNLSGVATGRIGLILQQPTNGTFDSGENALASLELKIKSNAPKGSYPLTFQNLPSYPEVVNASAEELAVSEWSGATLTVLNIPPQAVDDNFQIAENLNLSISPADLSANDIDPDDTTLTVTLSSAQTGETPTTGTITTDAQGNFVYSPGPSFLDLAQGQTRNDVFYYQVTDPLGDGDRGTVTVTVNGTEFEGDLSPASHGNNVINSDDLTRIGRLVVGLDPSPTGSQFQRADTAPRSLGGDGRLSVADYIQVGRYAAGLDNAPVYVHGPTQP